MAATLKEILGTFEVAKPVAAGSLQLFGLIGSNEQGVTYTTLDESLSAGTLEVQEVDEAGRVPELKVVNKAVDAVLLVAGEQVVGAKQNRVLNASIMVGGHSTTLIPVTCVERGRWGYRSSKFRSSGSSSHSFLRKMMSQDVVCSLRRTGRISSDQGAVWAEIDRKLHRMKSPSGSRALEQAYEDHRVRLSSALESASVPSGCCGVVFAFGGRIVGMDMFDKPATLNKLLPKLARAYAIDAMEEAEPTDQVTAERVRAWLQSVEEAPTECYQSPGLGKDIRVEADDVVGASLLVDDVAVHTELFREVASDREHGAHDVR